MTTDEDAPDPSASAQVIVDSLDTGQLRRYLGTSDRAEALRRLTSERREAGPVRPADVELTDGQRERLGEEHRSATAVVDAALGPGWRLWQVLSGTALMLSGWLFLGCGLLAIVIGLFTGAFTQVFRLGDGWRWRFDELGAVTGLLVALSATGLALAVVVMALTGIAGAVRNRRVRPALLEWTVQRPGQLGRGLPGLEGAGTGAAVLGSILPWVVIAGWVVVAFCLPVSAVVLLTSLLGFELEWFLTCLAFFAGSVALAYLLVHLSRWFGRRSEADARVAEAFAWRWAESEELRARL